MSTKEKAIYLVRYYTELLDLGTCSYIKGLGKQCAMKCVNEILNNSVLNYSGSDFSDNEILSDTEFWENVKKEIESI